MNEKISVLMSTYNENLNEIKQSINSILDQSFKDFEFIVVNDNPERKDLRKILTYYKKKDTRIKIINNSKNIGLACSLNKAAQSAKAPYLARMDADDISMRERLEKQYNFIRNSKFDIISSGFIYIDKDNKKINRKSKYYNENEIEKTLPYGNVIHHPTVLMTKKSFDKVSGYRNFSSAQDYDLWLRLLYEGFSFYMIKENLLKYRVRSNSITAKNKLQQKCTINYIQKLYMQRLKSGKDNYSYDDYIKYLRKNKTNNKNKKKEMKFHTNILLCANYYLRKNNYVKGFLLKSSVFFLNDIYRKSFYNEIIMKLLIMRLDLFKYNQKE